MKTEEGIGNQSIIVEIDEATKNVMEDIQSGIDASIANNEENIINSVKESEDYIVGKLRNLDTLNGTLEELRNASLESQKLTEMVSPLNKNLTDTETHILDEVNRLKVDIAKIEGIVLEVKGSLSTIPETLEKQQIMINSILEKITKHSEIQLNALNEQKQKNCESYERIMLALNIIKNLVTPFWKRNKNIEL